MAVTYGQIRDWQPGDAGKLADAMQDLLAELQKIEDGLRDAKAWVDWRDSAGEEAAEKKITGIADYVTDRAAEAERVRDIAADTERSLEPLKSQVTNVESFAFTNSFSISDKGVVTDALPTAPVSAEEQAERERIKDSIAQSVDAIVESGRAIEAAAAHGLSAVNLNEIDDGGATSVSGASYYAESTYGVGDIPGPDASPATVNAWWNSLTETQQEQVADEHPDALRNLGGIPSDVRDELNRATVNDDAGAMDDEIRRLQHDLDALPLLLRYSPYARYLRVKLAHLQDRRSQLTKLQKSLEGSDTYLLEYDNSKNLFEAAVAVGNPDTAQHVAITTPGFRTTLDAIEGKTGDARDLRNTTAELTGLPKDDISTIAYIGYQAPQGADVLSIGKARDGGRELAAFAEGIVATNGEQDLNLSLLGHSYGSTTSGFAAQFLYDDGSTPVDNFVAYGSPGFPNVDADGNYATERINTPRGPVGFDTPRSLERDMGLSADRAFFMRNDGDVVAAYGRLGDSPEDWGMTQLSTDTEQSLLGNGPDDTSLSREDYNVKRAASEPNYDDVSSHSGYHLRSMTGHENLAAVVGGLSELAHR